MSEDEKETNTFKTLLTYINLKSEQNIETLDKFTIDLIDSYNIFYTEMVKTFKEGLRKLNKRKFIKLIITIKDVEIYFAAPDILEQNIARDAVYLSLIRSQSELIELISNTYTSNIPITNEIAEEISYNFVVYNSKFLAYTDKIVELAEAALTTSE